VELKIEKHSALGLQCRSEPDHSSDPFNTSNHSHRNPAYFPLPSPPSFPTSVGSGKLSGGHLNIMLESSHGNFGLDGFGDEALLVRQVM
jgi:hypothetical protein